MRAELNPNEELNASQMSKSLLSMRLITDDLELLKYMAEVLVEKNLFKEALMKNVFKSSESENKMDHNIINAAANSITVLIAANVSFANMNLSQIQICGANIRDGCFNGCNFTEANLSGVSLENCKLNNALFNRTNMKDISLGIYPDINTGCSPVLSLCCSPNEEGEILVGCGDHSIKLYSSKGELIKIFEGPKLVNNIAISPDGKCILSGCECYQKHNSMKLWDVETGNLIKTFESHFSNVTCVAFSHDGKLLLSGSRDCSIRL